MHTTRKTEMVCRPLLSFAFMALCSHLPAFAWPSQSCASRHRLPVTVEASASGHSGEIRLDLTGADFPTAYNFSSNGDDIRVLESDDTTPIDFVVTAWDAGAQTATLYLRPRLSRLQKLGRSTFISVTTRCLMPAILPVCFLPLNSIYKAAIQQTIPSMKQPLAPPSPLQHRARMTPPLHPYQV